MYTRLLHMFYRGGGIGSGGAIKLNKLVRKASSVVGMKPDSVEAVTERRMSGKLL